MALAERVLVMPPSTGIYFITRAGRAIVFVDDDARDKLYLFTKPFAQDVEVSPSGHKSRHYYTINRRRRLAQ
jgi:hypothetical protein